MRMLVFRAAGESYAIALDGVVKVARFDRAIELAPLLGAPPGVLGALSVDGMVVPVGDLRRRPGLPDRFVTPADVIVVARLASGAMGVVADGAVEVVDCGERDVAAARAAPPGGALQGGGRLPSGARLIDDLADLIFGGESHAKEALIRASLPGAEGQPGMTGADDCIPSTGPRPPIQVRPQRHDILVFAVGDRRYAVETRFVREVCRVRLTELPCAPAFVLGIVNLRGVLWPVLDLQRLLSLPKLVLSAAARESAAYAVLLHSESMEFGIAAEAMMGVRSVGAGEIAPPGPAAAPVDTRFLRGVTPDDVFLLDTAFLLSRPEFVVDEHVVNG
jgi:purine-binding chemotaxis protein CheW